MWLQITGHHNYSLLTPPVQDRDVSQPAKIWSRRIAILYFKSVGFESGFVTRLQLVQFNLDIRLLSTHWITIYLGHYTKHQKWPNWTKSGLIRCLLHLNSYSVPISLFLRDQFFAGRMQWMMNKGFPKEKSKIQIRRKCLRKSVGFRICKKTVSFQQHLDSNSDTSLMQKYNATKISPTGLHSLLTPPVQE